ncbi:MAG TPA: porphobilinogen synthase [Methanocorpusculum sp.]|nr:porphobilinogen synthase [Methanocorpusculum sp.]HJK49545.1 porphobilinogen synthase [Methanocorpusculum sp.]HJK55613.1 porphobilinogen synthase [Methanocorpusculum sp.]HJK63090.1 porphobilinogen synthase [Methanocorpusculum sp.]HJK64329.1 porphobilinogen synthase [Methanocorpusculum sp.]
MFPQTRLRRLRRQSLRPLFTETHVTINDLIMPLFFVEGAAEKVPIASMPGQFRWPLSAAADVAKDLAADGIKAVILFGIPKTKDAVASSAFASDGVIQEATRAIKAAVPEMVVITDLCACEYTDHGHCGIIHESCDGPDLDNDASLELMQKIAVSQAEAGADMVAPSCMLDGMVTAIRTALDEAGYEYIPIMSYSTKFASALYGPFREAADSGFSFGDRSTYQMNPANGREAFRESLLDMEEGADILMVKPASFYLDVLAQVRELGLPTAAYQVSGEYSMIKAAAQNGWIDEKRIVMESLTSIKRAGADLIITYYAQDVARWLA